MVDVKKIGQEIRENKANLLDIREKVEWDNGHLKLAINFPLSLLEEGEEPSDDVDRDLKLYIHCQNGNRVMMAAPLLENIGFSNVVILNQSFEQLLELGMEKV